jgi:hypothetical protein
MTREEGTGNREQGTGNREQVTGATPRGQVTGYREQVLRHGDRLQGIGKRFWPTLLFVTYVGFFPFTYLSPRHYMKKGKTNHSRHRGQGEIRV